MSEPSRSTFNRRTLLKAAVAAGGYWSFPQPAKSATPLEKLNIGHIGVGNRGFTNVFELKDENILGLCDVDANYLARASELHPQAKTLRDYRELLELPDLDAVVISAPDHQHAPMAAAALRRGLHLYCEKPLTRTIREARELAQLATESGRTTQFGNQHHTSIGYRLAAAWLRSGKLGSIREVHAWTNRPIWPQGIERPAAAPVPPTLAWDLWLGDAPERPYADGYHPFGWRGFWDFGCGALGDMGPHLLDPVVAGLQLPLPTTIAAESSPVNEETAPKWSIVRFEFPAGKDRGPVAITWYDGGKRPPTEITTSEQPPPNGVMVLGERARLFIPVLGGRPLVLPEKRGDRIDPPELDLQPISHQQQWAGACRGQAQPACDFSYGALLTEICLLGNVALRIEKPLHWDAARMQAIDCPQANRFVNGAAE